MSGPIATALEDALRADARERRVVIEAGPVYVIVEVDDDQVAIDTPRSATLPPTHRLSPERAKLLRGLGFAKPLPVRDFRSVRARRSLSVTRLAEEIVDIVRRVYGESATPSATLQLDARAAPTNPSLGAAMRRVAKPPFDHSLRMALYNELVNASFLVPLTDDPDDDAPLVLETLIDRPVWAAFSELEELRAWRPRGAEWIEMHGSELFTRGAEDRVGSIRINPDGAVGGELYGHEVESLAEAVRRHFAARRH